MFVDENHFVEIKNNSCIQVLAISSNISRGPARSQVVASYEAILWAGSGDAAKSPYLSGNT